MRPRTYSSSDAATSVMIDDVKGGYDATRYLLKAGHTKIGFMGGREDNLHTIRRLEGYQKALYEAGILYNPEIVCFGNWDKQSGYNCIKELGIEKMTAMFCANDQMSGGIYEYLNEIGKMPGEDLSIVGFDDMVIAQYFIPGLTTCAIDLKQIGRISARKLIDEIEKPQDCENRKVYIPCNFVERASVKKI